MSTPYRIPVEETFSWQRPIINQTTNTPPGSPTKGDRYIVGPAPTGAWTGNAKKITWYDGTVWRFDSPSSGWATYDLSFSPPKQYTYDGSAWVAATADMAKAVYDTNNNGIVDKAESVDDGVGNATTAAQVKLAYDSRGVYDPVLGVIVMNL